MKPEAAFLNQPIRSLQTMLRTLAEYDPRHETLVPDGIYGPATKSAVTKFQRLHGLSATGVTDQQTWEQTLSHQLTFAITNSTFQADRLRRRLFCVPTSGAVP